MLLSSEEEAILFVIIPIKAQSTPRSCAQEAKLLPSIGTALLKRKSHQSIMHDYKIVILGPGGVGKSALTVQYVQGIFVEKYDPTIEDSYRKQVKVDGQHCMLEILDTAGTMQFGAMRDLYIKNGRGFALVYSITSRLTFIDLKEHRDHVTKIKDTDDIPMLLVGNKCDLEDERCISKEEGQRLAKEWNIPFMETSAKTLHNVTNIFENLVRQINGEQPHVLRLGTWSQSLSTSKVEKRRVCLVL